MYGLFVDYNGFRSFFVTYAPNFENMWKLGFV